MPADQRATAMGRGFKPGSSPCNNVFHFMISSARVIFVVLSGERRGRSWRTPAVAYFE